ncbi:MAG: hypothetical protein M3063_10300 [Actinomycetota bacterium]|nr:hypothetical protein [Actinomycetota bacterium]
MRALRWKAADVGDQLDDLIAVCGPPLGMAPEWQRDAASMATTHGLTFYDAAWAAAARGLRISLISSDAQLIAAELAESPTEVVDRLRLRA